MRRRLVLAVGLAFGLSAALAGCGTGQEPSSSTPTSPGTTMESPSTTTTPTTATTAPIPALALIVAGASGLDYWTPDGTTPLVAGRAVEVAFDDLGGGVVFQYEAMAEPELEWSADAGRWVFRWPSGTGPEPVRQLTEPGREPEVLLDLGDQAVVTLLDVGTVDGRPTLAYTRYEGMTTPPAEAALGDYRTSLVLRDLESGTDTDLGVIRSLESDAREPHLGEDLLAIEHVAYGERVARVVVGAPTPATVEETFGHSGPWWCEQCRVTTDLAPVGDMLGAYIAAGEEPATFRVIDTQTQETTSELSFDPEGWVALWLDFDGQRALVGMNDELGPEPPTTRVVLFEDGQARDLPVEGRAAFVFSVRP